nr:putative disease resistance protein At1g50180 [Quercus suber]
MAEAIVSGVVQRLGNLLIQESNFLSGVSDQVEQLQTELKLMQCLLKDADARQDESHFVRQLVAEIRDLAYDADDIIATYALKVESRRGGGIKKVLKRYAYIIDEGTTVHKVGSEIPKIMTRISNLTTRLLAMGIRESTEGGRLSSLSEKEQKQRQTYSYLEHDPVGFDDHRNELVEFLLKEEEGKRIASICGMGGLGKTTLAKMVYRHDRVRQHFDHHAWIFVSQQFQIRDIWERILFSLLSPSEEERNEIRKLSDEHIVEKLRQVQCEKKCLVILDDIWHIEDWNRLCLREAFPESGSKILLTTRSRDVALHADPRGLLHELHCLNEAKSLELFKKIAISWREELKKLKKSMNCLGEKMIKYCGGLPLAITILGGLLATKQRQDEWEDVLKHIESYIFKEDDLRVNNVLGLSYNDLPYHLKPCFLYLGHFPEDFEILTDELIQMWMGEGFIQLREDSEDTMEYEGEQYLRELKQRYMVQVGEISKLGRIETYRIHDLMREFCISKAQQENFLQITKENIHFIEGSQWHIGKIRRLAITLESNDNYFKGIKFSEYPYLRSLHYFVPPKEFYFKKSKLLRVLNLKNYGENFPKDIGCFIHLRFLSLKNSKISKVPSSLGNLRCLQTLDLRLKYYKVRVPNVFKEMEQLRHLYLPSFYWVSEKLELGNLCYLQTLLSVGLKTIKMPTSVRLNLRILGLGDHDYRPFLGVKTGEVVPHVIQVLSIFPHVYTLVIDSGIKKLPETRLFPPNLAELGLVLTKLEEDPMPTLEKLPNLKILRLFANSFVGKDMVCSEGGFPLLQYLILCGLYSLEEWRVEERAMPSLYHLTIDSCYYLKTIPDGLRFLTTLQVLEIKSMPKSFKDRLNEGGLDSDKVKHVPSLVFKNCDRE